MLHTDYAYTNHDCYVNSYGLYKHGLYTVLGAGRECVTFFGSLRFFFHSSHPLPIPEIDRFLAGLPFSKLDVAPMM